MIFKIPDDYTIPLNLNFTFTEFCFGNKWSLIWDGNQWNGDNCQGKKKDATYTASHIDTSTRNIELYLNYDYVEPIDEINWDRTINPFEYIIKQQFYEITPRPDAATTLYTDFNITSSKIITADNITTMRSDLNLVSNTLDVVNVDLTNLTNKVSVLNEEVVQISGRVDELDTELGEVKTITEHLQKMLKPTELLQALGWRLELLERLVALLLSVCN